MLRCLAVDDEPLALDLLEDNISKVPFLKLIATCRNGFEAIEAINKNEIDLIFLDIQMPGLTGIQFLNTLQATRPMVVFITAYEKFALEGYNLNVLDYLLKPVAFERFFKACQKAKEMHELKSLQNTKDNIEKSELISPYTEGVDFFFVNANYGHIKIVISDISHIESMRDYLKIYTISQIKPIITRMTLKVMEEKLANHAFLRVHKSFIVSIAKIDSIQAKAIFIGKHKIPVSDSYKDSLSHLVK